MLSLGLVWLLMPHHPDMGLPASADVICAADPACDIGRPQRDAIFQRLRAVRSEIQMEKQVHVLRSGVVYEQGEGQQKAGSPPFSLYRMRREARNLPGQG